mgnify:CR=1 FL=1
MLPEKLENALKNPKTTAQGVAALVAALALAIFGGLSDGLGGENLGELGGVLVLLAGAVQRIFFAKDKPKK